MDKREYKELCSMAANGDAKAFSRLYETVYGAMYYTAFYSLASDADAIEVVLGTARDGFNAINRLRAEETFRVFMFKTLCARIRTFFKDYGSTMNDRDYGNEIKNALFTLDNLDRMCVVMSVAAKFTPEEISFYSGMSKRAVRKRIARAKNSAEILNHKNTRREMLHKVVPEDVLPQNIIIPMIDESAELPEPDAFTFLMRLRDLGIGSVDFLCLLEGCGAPDEAVEKIRANPAMNLQGLILTLENARLTGEDYTRMLYTARQVWERTLTMRLERSEKISEGDYPDETEDEEQFEEPSFTEVFDKVSGELNELGEQAENAVYESAKAEEQEQAESFTATFDKVSDELNELGEQAENAVYESAKAEEQEQAESFTATFDKVSDELNELGEQAEKEFYESAKAEEQEQAESFTATFDKVSEELNELGEQAEKEFYESAKAEEQSVSAGYNGDTTAIIKLDPERIQEELSKLTDGEQGEDDESLLEEFLEPEPSPYHKRALVFGAAGAAAVIACGAVAGIFFEPHGSMSYAASASDIFVEIYNSYNADTSGGEIVCAFPEGNCGVFGDLLVSSEGLGTFIGGDLIYCVEEDAVSVSTFPGGNTAEKLAPPDGSGFVGAFEENGGIIAVFSGKQSGFMRIADGKTQYISSQDGVLTDFRAENGEITLATVYTPIFTRSFSVSDTYVYLPGFYAGGSSEKQLVSERDVIISGVPGYSYAVNITYQTADGTVKSSAAAIGNPLCVSADGRCVMNGEGGMIIEMGRNPSVVEFDKADYAAFCENGSAIAVGEIVYIRDRNGKITATVENLAEKPESLRFAGDLLIISGKNDILITLDCSDIKAPKTFALKAVQGVVNRNSAIVLENTDAAVTLSQYTLEDGKSKLVTGVSGDISLGEGSKPILNANTAVFGDDSCGAAFDYFDGVSVVSRFELFGKERKTLTLYDDKTGFSFAFARDGRFYAVSSGGTNDILK